MGVDIFYFVDHDLPTDSAENFMKEFSKRVNGNVEVYDWSHECDECDKEYWRLTEYSSEGEKVIEFSKPDHSKFMKDDKWYVCYDSEYDGTFESNFPNPSGDLQIHYSSEKLNVDLHLAKNTLMIWGLKKNWDDKIDCYSWYTVDSFFSENREPAHEWKELLVAQIKEILKPIFHCTEVLLVKDSSSYEHETLHGEFLREDGNTIEEALKRNSDFETPCDILRNDEVFGHDEDLEQPFFLFDV